jgi:hypothetical protein
VVSWPQLTARRGPSGLTTLQPLRLELTPRNHRLILAIVSVSSRRIATLVVTLGLLAGAWRPCAGWEATPEARMSCCLRKASCAKHKGASNTALTMARQAEADACCAASERPDPYQSPSVALAPPVFTPLVGLFAEPPIIPVRGVVWHRPPPLLANRDTSTHLLLSVFLI